MAAKKKFAIVIDKECHDILKKLSRDDERSMSATVRNLIKSAGKKIKG